MLAWSGDALAHKRTCLGEQVAPVEVDECVLVGTDLTYVDVVEAGLGKLLGGGDVSRDVPYVGPVPPARYVSDELAVRGE